MKNKHFRDILDYGIFKTEEMKISEIPTDVDWEMFKYYSRVKTKSGEIITCRSPFSGIRPQENDIGFLGGERIMDGKYPLANADWVLLFENGFLSKWLRVEEYEDKIKKLIFQVETTFPQGIQIGNPVFVEGQSALDGKYTTGRFGDFDVKNGKVVEELKSNFSSFEMNQKYKILYSLISMILFGIGIFFLTNINSSDNNLFYKFLDFSFAVLFILSSLIYTFYFVLFKIRFEKESIVIGGKFNTKIYEKKEFIGYYIFENPSNSEKYALSLVHNDHTQIIFDFFFLKKKYSKIEKIISKDFNQITGKEQWKLESAKHAKQVNWSYLKDGMIIGLTISGLLLFLILFGKSSFIYATRIIFLFIVFIFIEFFLKIKN